MGSNAEKLLAALRQSRRNWNYGDLTAILKHVGFEWRDSKHRVFRHPDFPQLGSYPIPRADSLPPAYARDVLRLAEAAIDLSQKAKGDKE